MCIGIALYNTDNLSSQKAYALAEVFFKLLNIKMTDAAYRTENRVNTNVTADELNNLTANNKVRDFRIYHKDHNILPWAASFGYVTDMNGSFYHVDIQYAYEVANEQEIILNFLKFAAETTAIPYGIAYNQDNVVDAFDYAIGEGIVPIPSYEKHLVWREETPGEFNGPARYKNTMLRMVYKYNLINANHLRINIQNQALGDWITSNPKHGSLSAINDNSFIWVVAEEQLNYINNICGEAGILIAWNDK